jgi:hypothetical protein
MIDLKPTLAAHAQWLADPATGQRANLCGANLSGANLSDANLSRANLGGANLSDANLSRANLCGASGLPVVADSAERLIAAAAAATAEPGALAMQTWHTCETTHCLGGWAIHQAGPLGTLLEQTLGAPIAALLLLGPEAYAHFYDSNEDALAYLRSVLDEAKA